MKVSIIIPIYNTGKALNKCLNSVCCQTYRNLEIIIVNDKSTDTYTIERSREWAKKDSRIVLIENDINLGIERARLTALARVSGEALTFMDHDDWYSCSDAIETMVNNMNETSADIVIARASNRFLQFKKPLYDPVPAGVTVGGGMIMEEYYCSFFGINMITVDVWNKLYRTTVVREANIKASNVKYCDDMLFNMFVWPHLNKMSVIDKDIYIHNYGGLSSRYNYPMKEYHKLYDIRIKELEKYGLTNKLKKFLDIEMKNVLMMDIKTQYDTGIPQDEIERFIKEELQHPHWNSINETLRVMSDPICKHIVENDVSAISAVGKLEHNRLKNKIKLCVKRLFC